MTAPISSPGVLPPVAQPFYPQTMYQTPGYPASNYPVSNYPGLNTASPGIAAPFPQQTLAVQQYMPLAQRHTLTPEDEMAIQQGLDRWYPKILPGYSTPLPQMLADPVKKAALVGGITGVLVGLAAKFVPVQRLLLEEAGEIVGTTSRRLGAGWALLIGAAVALLTGVTSFFGTRQRNDNILDMMARLPAGATRRDMLSDPVVQADRTQAAMASGGGGGGDLLTGMLLANMMGGSGMGGSTRIVPRSSIGGSRR
ncbi:MAG: hypothetical protein VKJ04_03475 [Vampirovibrionales bacterium]|nr:hypothetical protein [Vampirovibrionales bacterium]